LGVGKWIKLEREVTNYFPASLGSNPPQPAYVGEWYYQTTSDGRIIYGGQRINSIDRTRFWMKGK
jgi:hypothetical protein